MTRAALLAFVVVLLLPILERPAIAHRMGVFARTEGAQVRGQAYFADGSPCVDCIILGQNPAGNTIVRSVTDSDGRFAFPTPSPMDLTVIAESELGHRGLFMLSTAAPAADALAPLKPKQHINSAPAPEETATPWAALAAGLALIATVFTLWALLARKRSSR